MTPDWFYALTYPARSLRCLWFDVCWFFSPYRAPGPLLRTKPASKEDRRWARELLNSLKDTPE